MIEIEKLSDVLAKYFQNELEIWQLKYAHASEKGTLEECQEAVRIMEKIKRVIKALESH